MQIAKDDYYISDDPEKVNIATLKRLLSPSYWAPNRSIDAIKATIKHSVCFSVHKGVEQIAFARVVTDYATFAYIADVIIDVNHNR